MNQLLVKAMEKRVLAAAIAFGSGGPPEDDESEGLDVNSQRRVGALIEAAVGLTIATNGSDDMTETDLTSFIRDAMAPMWEVLAALEAQREAG